MVATEMPMGCRSSNTFLVDTSCLENAEDIRADDNGKFRHNGRKLDIFAVNDEGEVEQLEEKPKSLQPDHYKLYRSYWSHTSNSNFKIKDGLQNWKITKGTNFPW